MDHSSTRYSSLAKLSKNRYKRLSTSAAGFSCNYTLQPRRTLGYFFFRYALKMSAFLYQKYRKQCMVYPLAFPSLMAVNPVQMLTLLIIFSILKCHGFGIANKLISYGNSAFNKDSPLLRNTHSLGTDYVVCSVYF